MRTACSYLLVAALSAAATYALVQVRAPHPPLETVAAAAPQVPAPPAEAPALVAPTPVAELDPDLSPEERINVEVYQRVNRGVVNITSRSRRPNSASSFASFSSTQPSCWPPPRK